MSSSKLFVATLVCHKFVTSMYDDDWEVTFQHRFIRAADAESAFQRAMTLGAEIQAEQHAAGHTGFHFCGLGELHEQRQPEPTDGAELFTWFIRGHGPNYVRDKERLAVFQGPSGRLYTVGP